MRKDDIRDVNGKLLSPSELKRRFALPHAPTHFSRVELPQGTTLRVGVTNPPSRAGGGDVVQYQIGGEDEETCFKETQFLGGRRGRQIMGYEFRAEHIFAEDNENEIIVGFANDELEPSKYLILERAHQFDEQDEELKMDRVFIQVEDQSRSNYGGITAIAQRDNLLIFELDEKAKRNLQINGRIKITLDEEDSKLRAVLALLAVIADRDDIPHT